jgi:hypothetical protein
MRRLLLQPTVCLAQTSTYGTGKNNAGRCSLGAGVEFALPVTAGIKYYFKPGTLRFYGAFDIGITSFTTSTAPINILGHSIGSVSATTTEFTWQPQLGVLGYFSNNAASNLSVRWIGISDANSFGIRFGFLYDLGGSNSGS